LRIYRKRLHENPVKAQLGFLYAGYRDEHWWFEMVDIFHKLFITSILAFFPQVAQLPTGMVVVILYMITLLVVNPYFRVDDDRLHLLAQTELFLLLCAGNVFYNLPVHAFNATDDVYLSIALIAITIFFFLCFLYAGYNVLQRIVLRWWNKRQAKKLREEAKKAKEMKKASEQAEAGMAAVVGDAEGKPNKPKIGGFTNEDEEKGVKQEQKSMKQEQKTAESPSSHSKSQSNKRQDGSQKSEDDQEGSEEGSQSEQSQEENDLQNAPGVPQPNDEQEASESEADHKHK